jgi:hypothetical protein
VFEKGLDTPFDVAPEIVIVSNRRSVELVREFASGIQ